MDASLRQSFDHPNASEVTLKYFIIFLTFNKELSTNPKQNKGQINNEYILDIIFCILIVGNPKLLSSF